MRCTFIYFFFNDTATTEIYTLSLHDALPIFSAKAQFIGDTVHIARFDTATRHPHCEGINVMVTAYRGAHFTHWSAAKFTDRKSTRLNSSHANISYAVFCLKKKRSTQSSSSPR